MEQILSFLEGLGPLTTYVILGLGAALENIFPPIPADTFVVLGGFLAARGSAAVGIVFLVTWGTNVASALAVYGMARHFGPDFFHQGLGRRLLKPKQVERMRQFMERFGLPAIFLARFLPGFRVVVPAFAGVSGLGFLPVALPLVAASGIWYGGLVWVGAQTGANLETIAVWLGGANRALLLLALLAAIPLVWWWVDSFGGDQE